MELQVQEVAYRKHGSAEDIEAKIRASLDAKLHSRLRKKEEDKAKQEREVARLKRIRREITAEGGGGGGVGGGGASAAPESDQVEEI